jgi:hypothetical protein
MLLPTCEYEYYELGGMNYFKCLEPVHTQGVAHCIFHDRDYLKGDNYERHKQEVADRFQEKLSECSSKNIPFEFIGYCLPKISIQHHN